MVDREAPLASLATVAPSLDSSPLLTPKNDDVTIDVDQQKNDKAEVTFEESESSSSESSSDDDDICDDESAKPLIPDGGWGWVVVFASLILSMIMDGISFSFGLLYPKLLLEFEASSSETSWIGSLFMAVPLLSGPVMSALVDKYGCRSMTVVGGLISAVGFIISSKVNTIGLMYLSFGVISGLGLGLGYVTAVVSVAFWFDKKRTLAVGLAASGTGVGTFVFAPLTNWLLNEFDWRGTTLILGGLFLDCCVCGMLMIDPDWITSQNKENSKLSKSSKSSKTSLVSLSSTNFASVDINQLKNMLKSGKDAEYFLQSLETSIEHPDKNAPKNIHNSLLNLPTFIKQNEKVPVEVLEQLSANKRLYNVILENYPSLLLSRSYSDKGLNKLAEDAAAIERVPVTFCMKLKKDTKPPLAIIKQESLPEDDHPVLAAQKPLLPNGNKQETSPPPPPRNISFPWLKQHLVQAQKHNYFKNMKVHRQSLIHRGAIFNINKYRFKASSCPNIYRLSMLTLPKNEEEDEKWYAELVDLVKGMFDFSLFLELHFFLLSLSTIILFVWFIVPYFYLADHMSKFDYTDEDASFTISNIGITNTIGMIVLGWAGDRPWINISKTYAVALVLCGVSMAGIVYFTENFIMLEVCAGFFGIFLASSFSFTPGIIVELIPLERFTLAYGLQLLCMGIGILVGPPFAGHLYDVTKSYKPAFYQGALWIITSGILVALIPYTKNRKMFGTGPVEKEIEGVQDRVVFAVVYIFLLLSITVGVMYLTIQSLI